MGTRNSQKDLTKYYKQQDKKRKKYDKYNPLEENERKKKYTYLDSLFFRIFLSSIILLSLVVVGKAENKGTLKTGIVNNINANFNFIKLARLFNGVFGTFIPIDDPTVYSSNIYESVVYENNVNKVTNYEFDGVTNLVSGVVTKIKKDKNGLYDITIQGSDDYVYTYIGLENIDHSLYSYIKANEVIGKAVKENTSYKFRLIIYKNGAYYDFYQNAEN